MRDKEFLDYVKVKYQQLKDVEEKGYFTKICQVCGKEFKLKIDNRLYCSDKCKKAKDEKDRKRRLERNEEKPLARPLAKNKYAENHNLLFIPSDKATDFYSYDLKKDGLSDPVKISDSILSGLEFDYYMSIKAITFMKPIATSTAPIFEEEFQNKKEELCKTQIS